ncbi:MAG: phage holin family protein [Desulfuromonas sp.]|mgnify:FL=1|nr:MAG: phage holin family protein [Desulfuromonas sp.]
MPGLLIRWFILTLAILFAGYMVDGITVSGIWSALFAALVLGMLNALLRPLLIILTLPLTLLSLGLFTFVINAFLLLMTSGVIGGLVVDGFGAALGGALVITLASWLLTVLVSDRGQIEVVELRNRDGVFRE